MDKMKIAFYLALLFSIGCGFVFITGVNNVGIGSSSEYTGEPASVLERILSGALCLLSGVFAYGLKKRKRYAWVAGKLGFVLLTLAILANMIYLKEEQHIGMVIWGIVSQFASAGLVAFIYFKFWKPLKDTTFK